MKWPFKTFDVFQGPKVIQFGLHLLTNVSRLSEQETEAARQVLGPRAIHYEDVRIAEGRLLRLVFKLNGSRAFTLFRTINLPSKGSHSRGNFDLLVHELVHVYQFELAGSLYIWQALRSRRYGYGGWQQLVKDREKGKRLRDYNREQQGQIVQDYYRNVVLGELAPGEPVSLAYEPFIGDLQAGRL